MSERPRPNPHLEVSANIDRMTSKGIGADVKVTPNSENGSTTESHPRRGGEIIHVRDPRGFVTARYFIGQPFQELRMTAG